MRAPASRTALAGVVGVLLTLLTLLLTTSSASAASSLPTTPSLDGRTIADMPRLLDVGQAVDVELQDRWGRAIPFTGPGREGSVVYPPTLPPGEYRLVSGDSSATFTVKSATFSEGHDGYELPSLAAGTSEPAGVPWPVVLLVLTAGGTLALVLVRRHRGLAVAAGALAVLAAAGVVLAPRAEPTASASPPSIKACRVLAAGDENSAPFRDCVFDRLASTFEQAGLRAAMAEMDAQPLSVCHEVIHQLGVYAWIRLDDPESVLLPDLGGCNAAFYHGALYGASTYSDDDEFVRTATAMCPATSFTSDPNSGECYHGVGHAMALRFGGDTPRAREVCDRVAKPGTVHNAECVGAVYMQHAVKLAAAKGDPAFVPVPAVPTQEVCASESDRLIVELCYLAIAMGSPRTPETATSLAAMCNAEPVSRQVQCARGIATEFRSLLPGGGVEGAEVCTTLTDAEAQRECVSVHAHFSFDQFRDLDRLRAICSAADQPLDVCIEENRPSGIAFEAEMAAAQGRSPASSPAGTGPPSGPPPPS